MLSRFAFLFKLVLVIFCLCFPAESIAVQSTPSGTADLCLGCHSNKDFTAKLKNGEDLSLFVNKDLLENSVHNMLDCSGCHSGFSPEKHPSRILENRRAYAASGAAICKSCHTTFRTDLHGRMVKAAEKSGQYCVDCHGAHTVQPVSMQELSEPKYCLGCHLNKLSMTFKNGEKQSVQLDHMILKASVHNKLYCTDCHFGFSPEKHPIRQFKSSRDYVIASSESCRRCHFDKYTKTLESIHYSMLSHGNMKAPVCVDCHGAHSIGRAGQERTVSAKRCKKCHREIYKTYSSSVHGSALFVDHNQDVPVCADCHRAHNIEDPRTFDYREKIPGMCGGCHANKELMDKYGLSTAVLQSYLQDFHGITLKLYKKQKDAGNKITLKPIAVCVDCHGVHDITPTTGPKSSIVKANLVKRCRKCHPDATENFPDSWISHYKPSLQKAPIVYTINLIYKIFIPFMMVGLILQILLHIWRYVVNR